MNPAIDQYCAAFAYFTVHQNLTSLTPLFKGLNMPTKIGRTFTGTWEQLWPNALPVTTNDSYGYQQKLNPDSLGASPSP